VMGMNGGLEVFICRDGEAERVWREGSWEGEGGVYKVRKEGQTGIGVWRRHSCATSYKTRLRFVRGLYRRELSWLRRS